MDVFTNPPPHTYMLHTIFKVPDDRNGIPAIAFSRREYPFIIAIYTIAIQFLLLSSWKLISSLILGIFPLNPSNSNSTMTRYVGIIAFWNAADPWHAFSTIAEYTFKISRRSHPSDRGLMATALLFPSILMAVGGLILGIFYPSQMTLENAAPVQPSTVYCPEYPTVGNSTPQQIYSFQRPSILRSMGSAEAFDLNTKASSVYVNDRYLEESNNTHPQVEIAYGYNITGRDFGLQHFPSLTYQVKGYCLTEYSWLRPGDIGQPGQTEEYAMWHSETNVIAVLGPNYTRPGLLGFYPPFRENAENWDAESSNHSFAFVISSAGVGSYSASTDAWYFTEPLPSFDPDYWFGAAYRVKSGRPALSCWENLDLCYGGVCGFSKLVETLPKGTLRPLAERIAPVVVEMALQVGVGSLKVYSGSLNGQVIDASSGNMVEDFKRLILAAYLLTKETFRDLAITIPDTKMANALHGPNNELLPGAAGFIIRTRDVVALRLDMVVVVPVLLVVSWCLVGILTIFRRSHNFAKAGRFRQYCERSIAFQAAQLFRMLYVASGGEINDWVQWQKSPLPVPEKPTTEETTLIATEWNDQDGRWITFPGIKRRLDNLRSKGGS
jgi:hypothetical protein